jgi:hypothetical protein
VAAVEIKLSESLTARDIKTLAYARDALGEAFVRGVILYSGAHVVPMADKIFAVPIGTLPATHMDTLTTRKNRRPRNV